MKGLLTLRHLHLPGLTSYLQAEALQERLVRLQLDHKANPIALQAPNPVLLTFQTPPTYTCGRREIGKLSEFQIAHLGAGGAAMFYEAMRGGQTTWHGPGQLTAYLIISLREHSMSSYTYIGLLQDSVMATCKHLSLDTHTTENPGVWIGTPPDDRKIASIGVHLRRYIASHGIGLNVSVDLSWFDRIVACGLVGKKATSIEKELTALDECSDLHKHSGQDESSETLDAGTENMSRPVTIPISMEKVANVFANDVAARLPRLNPRVKSIAEEELWSE